MTQRRHSGPITWGATGSIPFALGELRIHTRKRPKRVSLTLPKRNDAKAYCFGPESIMKIYNMLFTDYGGQIGYAPAVATIAVCGALCAAIVYGGVAIGKAALAKETSLGFVCHASA
jgi:hypothetical protein